MTTGFQSDAFQLTGFQIDAGTGTDALTGTDLVTGAPTVSSPTLTSAPAVVATPSGGGGGTPGRRLKAGSGLWVAHSDDGEVRLRFPRPLWTGAPVVSRPVLHAFEPIVRLSARDLVVPAPVLGAPVLGAPKLRYDDSNKARQLASIMVHVLRAEAEDDWRPTVEVRYRGDVAEQLFVSRAGGRRWLAIPKSRAG